MNACKPGGRKRGTVLTYPDYRQACGWNAALPPRTAIRTLDADLQADVVVIGAGFTGLAAARRLRAASPAGRVVILEADTVGEGNPGRNSGFLLDIALANDADAGALERMRHCNRLIRTGMDEIRSLVETHGIACGLERTGTYRAAAGDAGRSALRRYRAFLEAAALPFEWLERAGLRRRLGTSFYREGLYSPDCWLVQPAALIRGLADHLPTGIELFERSPALSIKRRGEQRIVRAARGSVTAPLVVVANNAFCKKLDIGASRVAAIYTSAALTAPLPGEMLASLGTEPAWGLLPAHRLGSTLRRTADGRLLIRSTYSYEREPPQDHIARRLQGSLCKRFPQLAGVPFAASWSGATGFTLNGAPLWGEAGPGIYVSAGCNGGGIVKGTLFGRLLADLATGQPVPDMAALFGAAAWMPPEPFRRLGFQVVSALEHRKGRAEA
jgi:glycine/D-amino acid oxidase-like deaminating enzyme